MSRGRDKTLDELFAAEAAEAAERAETFEAWRFGAASAAGWPTVPDDAMKWLFEREPDPSRAGLVLLAWDMGAHWPAPQTGEVGA